LFGFANAGVTLAGPGASAWAAPLPLAIAIGLFAGKQAGIFGAVALSVRLGWARRPRGASWLQIYGVALLCGIGFTMSLFIASLAFPGRPALAEQAKIGILLGSLASAAAGYFVLRVATPSAAPDAPAADKDLIDLEGVPQAIDAAAKSDAARQEKLVLDPPDP
jgi:NhaA family Na+:H+ antiporter